MLRYLLCVLMLLCASVVCADNGEDVGVLDLTKDQIVMYADDDDNVGILDLTKNQIEEMAVAAAQSNDRRVYANGRVMSIKLIPPGGWDDSGNLHVLFEAISKTGWITQYIDENGDSVCDFSIDWQPVIISEVVGKDQRHLVYFMMKERGACPGGGGRL